MMKKHRSSKYSHKFKRQINPRPRTKSVMAVDRQKHIKRIEELKERVLPEQMKPRQCSPNPETSCNNKEGFCKNEGSKAVPEESLKQWRIRKRKSFQKEREREDSMKKWRKRRGKKEFCQKFETAAKLGQSLESRSPP